jgi:hypothetical protein
MITTGGYAMDGDTLLLGFMPGKSDNRVVEADKIFTTDYELYDYINGGAELYLNYGFKKLARRTYQLQDTNQIKAEIFDMGSPKNAFGVFSYAKSQENADIGQGGQYIGGSLIFWQTRYYISVFAQHENDMSVQEVWKIGKKISQAIGDTSGLPSVFYSIPQEKLVEGSTFYFHHHAWQNKFSYISNDNIFNINEKVLALLSQYGDPGHRYYLLLLEYPGKKEASKAIKKSASVLAEGLKKKKMVENEKGEWYGLHQEENLLIYVLESPDKKTVVHLINRCLEKYKQQEKAVN